MNKLDEGQEILQKGKTVEDDCMPKISILLYHGTSTRVHINELLTISVCLYSAFAQGTDLLASMFS